MNHRLRKKKGKVIPEECWNLDITFAKYILPRLKYYKSHAHGYPPSITWDEWMEILNKMIKSFELVLEDDYLFCNKEKSDVIQEGLNLFAEYYRNLWD